MSSTMDYQETRAISDVPLPAKVAAARASRAFDLVITVIAFFTIAGTFHLHYMLLAGDWDFWVDWKDRQFWPTVSRPSWRSCFAPRRRPISGKSSACRSEPPFASSRCCSASGLTASSASICGPVCPTASSSRATLLPGALFLDTVLLLSRNFLVTAIIGAWGFGLLFYPGNWPMLAPYHIPIEHMGQLESTADMVGYTFIRSSTPEYLRFIERGTLRTFGGHSAWISAFFSAFLCMMTYLVWWYIGLFFAKTDLGRKSDRKISWHEAGGEAVRLIRRQMIKRQTRSHHNPREGTAMLIHLQSLAARRLMTWDELICLACVFRFRAGCPPSLMANATRNHSCACAPCNGMT